MADNVNEKFYSACKSGNLVEMKLLMNENPDIDVNYIVNGSSPLHESVVHGCQFIEITKYLLSINCNVDIQDAEGQTPLHKAVMFNSIENVKLLLENNAKKEIEDLVGRTPLMYLDEDYDLCALFFEDLYKLNLFRNKKKKKNWIKSEKSTAFHANIQHVDMIPPSILKKRKIFAQGDGDSIVSPMKRVRFNDLEKSKISS